MGLRRWWVWSIAVAVGAGACSGRSPSARSTPTTVSQPRYSVSATVLADPARGPHLCLGGVETSLPPQCGGPPVRNFAWSEVPSARTLNGVTWGEARFVGTWDGSTFTLTERPTPAVNRPTPLPDFKAPCSSPRGGWTVVDPTKLTRSDSDAANSYIAGESDNAGSWIDQSINPSPDNDPAREVLVAAFTGDLARHEAALRRLWGGPLCITARPRPMAQLDGIVHMLTGPEGAAGLHLLGAGVDTVNDVVDATVILAGDAEHRWIAAHVPPGAVVVTGILQPT